MRVSCSRFKLRGPDAILVQVQLPRLRWTTDWRREEELDVQRVLVGRGKFYPVGPDVRPAQISSTLRIVDDFH